MIAKELLDFYNLLIAEGITIWIDGGWCVDALIGRQTRKHSDLDIAVERKDNAKLRRLLEDRGFAEEARGDSTEWTYVMKDAAGRQIDVHVFAYDKSGRTVYGIPYPYGSLTGKGMIESQQVNCVSPEWMFKFKTAYQPQEKDIQDVQALSDKFGFVLPASHHSSSQ